jgi:hypothetical protein
MHTLPDTRTRAQTPADVIVGVTVLLLTVGAVFAFLPMLFGGDVSGGGSENLQPGPDHETSVRLVEHLQEGVFASNHSDPQSPRSVSGECVQAFFNKSDVGVGVDTGSTACGYNTSHELAVLLGVRDSTRVNITITQPDSGAVVSLDGVSLQRGATVDAAAHNRAVASQVVSLDGSKSRVVVRVWGDGR